MGADLQGRWGPPLRRNAHSVFGLAYGKLAGLYLAPTYSSALEMTTVTVALCLIMSVTFIISMI